MKQYTIGDKEVQLATPVPKRVRGFLVCVGLKSLTELLDKEKAEELGKFLIDFQMTEGKIRELMAVCLTDAPDVDWDEVPTETINEVFSDFFAAVLSSYKKAQQSLTALV